MSETVTPYLVYTPDLRLGKCRHPRIKIILKDNGMIVGACQFCQYEMSKAEMEAALSRHE